jgi:hypothetical protein
MEPSRAVISQMRASLPAPVRDKLEQAIEKIVGARLAGRRVVVVTGSGPNIHEGVTTLIAELIHKGIVQGVVTSAAVVAHEMAGTLDRVKRIRIRDAAQFALPPEILPRGSFFEITCLSASQRETLRGEVGESWELYEQLERMPGQFIIKAAGNVAWPMGLRTERVAREAQDLATEYGTTVEQVAGLGSDPLTMIGAAAVHHVPVIVSVPQLVGGGAVGLAIGDAISITRRSRLVADLLASAEVIIESAIALPQEIHDGPFETYTGHGLWAAWQHEQTYSMAEKTLIRIDLDPNLERAWQLEREGSRVQQVVDRGLPKAKTMGIPFRMEMSGFARLEGSVPVTADIGVAWPIIASSLEDALGIHLDFISAPQESEDGQRMREWIVEHVQFLDRKRMQEKIESSTDLKRSFAAQRRLSSPDSP